MNLPATKESGLSGITRKMPQSVGLMRQKVRDFAINELANKKNVGNDRPLQSLVKMT